MANHKARASQAEIARALRAAQQACLVVSSFELGADGTVKVFFKTSLQSDDENEWDSILEMRE